MIIYYASTETNKDTVSIAVNVLLNIIVKPSSLSRRSRAIASVLSVPVMMLPSKSGYVGSFFPASPMSASLTVL